jgi:hypothetical protein
MNNPFTSKIYELTWLKYFTKYKKGVAFNYIDGLRFYKHSFLPYYINVGRNSTNGISYNLDPKARDFKKKTLLIYDVPSYYNIQPPCKESVIKLYRIKQYKGYLDDITSIESLDEFLAIKLTKKSRNKFRTALRRFEKCFDVKYTIYYDFISKEEYFQTMNEFKGIIIKRFETLKLDTNLIEEWPFYTELTYKMILEGKAALIAIRANNRPVSISLTFLGDTALVGAIKAFDSDYYKFNVGHILISKIFEFCIQKKLKYFDFSKGEYEYKSKWTNFEYQYYCHILYDSSNFTSCITAKLLARFFRIKQYLRDKNFNHLLVKIKYKLKNLKLHSNKKELFKITPLENTEVLNTLPIVNLEDENIKYPFLNRIVYDKLYQNPEPLKNLIIYKSESKKPTYFVVGEKSRYLIKIT